jgi:hypothetical protein
MEQKQKADEEKQAQLAKELSQQKEELESLKANHANQNLVLERRKVELKVGFVFKLLKSYKFRKLTIN